MRRIVFSLFSFRRCLGRSVLFLFNVIETNVLRESSTSEFSHSLDPDCVKTCTRGECAELFSLFSPFDGACQSGSFLIQRNRNKRSGPISDIGQSTSCALPGSVR